MHENSNIWNDMWSNKQENTQKTIGLNPLSPQWSRQAVDAGKIVFPPIYLSRLWIDFKFPDSDPHWARRNLVSCVLCAGVNILCKYVQMCVCVLACSWTWQWGWTTRDLESPPIIGKLKVWLVTYIYLVLLSWSRYEWKPGLEPEMDSGIWLCMGKVLGTPRHPSVDGYLPPCVLVYLINQVKKLD